ncbi:hypothetical protein ASZ90_005214 [hydrocarbon metagenome]|uniref:Uncharacterized protein n=1 Tax=hydrocarbon metagenome TaxID=938273 RepID=A0A0W8FVY8_9ZZZZ
MLTQIEAKKRLSISSLTLLFSLSKIEEINENLDGIYFLVLQLQLEFDFKYICTS